MAPRRCAAEITREEREGDWLRLRRRMSFNAEDAEYTQRGRRVPGEAIYFKSRARLNPKPP